MSTPPTSQKADQRPISFVLDDQTTLGGSPVSVNLAIRPEDLTRSDASRLNVQQTLGGAWGDNFGAGIPTISISGTTGWRPGADGLDGGERFQQLFDQVYSGWHTARLNAVTAGQDPDKVQLVFSDALDGFTVVVAPNNFVLRRSRSRPLIYQYQIAMTVLDQDVDPGAGLSLFNGSDLLNAATTQQLGLASLTQSINDITAQISNISGAIQSTLVAPVQAFMNETSALYSAVQGAITAGTGIAGQLISVARMTAQAGLNIFHTCAAVANLPTLSKGLLLQVAGAYMNVWCVLKNALNQQLYYPDYSPLFGASNCSSTNGGRPISALAGTNPFYSVAPTTPALPVQLTQSAQLNLSALASNDPVLAPMTTSALGAALQEVTNGMTVAA
jgi:hypothetical protein